ncbi:MAG: 50S ribosomal protein L29 [Armatimonadetes bacterium]|nr:50S ribosomal protein L29 [Armatimonadota bacterium]
MADKKTRTRLNELHGMGDADLDAAAAAARKAIYQFHKDRLSKPQENVKVVKNSRKEIARVLTIRRQRQIAAQETQS